MGKKRTSNSDSNSHNRNGFSHLLMLLPPASALYRYTINPHGQSCAFSLVYSSNIHWEEKMRHFFSSPVVGIPVQFPHFLFLHKYLFYFLSTGVWSKFSCSVIWFSTFTNAFFKSISSHFFSRISILLAKWLNSHHIALPCGRSNDMTTAGPKYS